MRTFSGGLPLRVRLGHGARGAWIALGLSFLAGAASAQSIDQTKREISAKNGSIQKLEQRVRTLAKYPPSSHRMDSVANASATPTPVRSPARAGKRKTALPTAAASGTGEVVGALGAPPMHERGRAVDGITAAAGGFGGALDGLGFYGGEASLTTPLGRRFGFQIDGQATHFDNHIAGSTDVAGGSAHLFWRDPAIGLLGLYGHYAHADAFGGFDLYAGGIEFARYWTRISFEGIAGIEGGSSVSAMVGGTPTTLTADTRFFDVATLSYYQSDNLRLSAGHSFTGGRHAMDLGIEWGVAVGGGTMAALFAQAALAEGGDSGVLGGLRFYFGRGGKTLIERHREDEAGSASRMANVLRAHPDSAAQADD